MLLVMRKRLAMTFWLALLTIISVKAQQFVSDTPMEPTPAYALGNTWGFKNPDGPAIVNIKAGERYLIVGGIDAWWIIQASSGEQYLVTVVALIFDLGIPPPESYISNKYIYPPGRKPVSESIPAPYYSGYTPQDTYIGPRGGEYYINSSGNKTYITPQSTIDREPVQTGPRGGQYYINGNGRKTYIKH
jgi:hypothetical protein